MRFLKVLGILTIFFLNERGKVESFYKTSIKKFSSPSSSGLVDWDKNSIFIDNERVFIQSGEFHPWRLPSTSKWNDIIQKFVALGLNTVSIYVHWGLVNPIEGRTDWSGFRSLQTVFDLARSAGLYVIVRPGPYINAETTAGGIPGWATVLKGPLRTNSTEFDRAWKQYWLELVDLIVPNQIGLPGGTVIAVQIENEYLSDQNSVLGQPIGKDGYMEDLSDILKDNGIVVPLTFNDAGMEFNFVKGQGSVDIYGFDSYPQSFDCSRPDHWKPLIETYSNYQDSLKIDSPLFIPEFQAGSYDSWGGSGYERCRDLTGPNFESLFYLNNLASNSKMINYYMVYGGTSWGYLPFPGVYTSYDYGAAISENRDIGTEKFEELKRQSFFLRSSKDFYLTEIVGNSSSKNHLRYFDRDGDESSEAFVTELRNPESGAGFYIVRAKNSTSIDPTSFRLKVFTSRGPKTLPALTLPARQSKILVTDYTSSQKIGKLSHHPIELLYTTSNVLLSDRIGDREVIYLFSDDDVPDQKLSNEQREISKIKIPGIQNGRSLYRSSDGQDLLKILELSEEVDGDGYLNFSWSKGGLPGINAISTCEATVIVTDKRTAGKVWNPIIVYGEDQTPKKTSILVWGPWLVRNATIVIDDHNPEGVLRLYGDFEKGVKKEVTLFTGTLNFDNLEWNGILIRNLRKPPTGSSEGFMSFFYDSDQVEIERFESLGSEPDGLNLRVGDRIDLGDYDWIYRDSLPEIRPEFDDGDWILADHESSTNHFKKLYGKYYLYACDYGFCNGATIWRGHFEQICKEKRSKEDSKVFNPIDQLRFSSSSDRMIRNYKKKIRDGDIDRDGSNEVLLDYGINLTISGGQSFVSSVWLNEDLLGNLPSENYSKMPQAKVGTKFFKFRSSSLKRCGSNTITIVQDNMGMDQTEDGFTRTVNNPRGILGYKIQRSIELERELDFEEGGFYENDDDYEFSEISWKVQGQLGGFNWLPDPERGILNENGFFGIRSGWHMPSYNSNGTREGWRKLSPIKDGLEGAGIGFFKTSFELRLSNEVYDFMISFEFEGLEKDKKKKKDKEEIDRTKNEEDPKKFVNGEGNADDDDDESHYRVEFWINGWHSGRFIPYLGPQFKFPVHDGILNLNGKNEISLSLWSLKLGGSKIDGLSIVIDKVLVGG